MRPRAATCARAISMVMRGGADITRAFLAPFRFSLPSFSAFCVCVPDAPTVTHVLAGCCAPRGSGDDQIEDALRTLLASGLEAVPIRVDPWGSSAPLWYRESLRQSCSGCPRAPHWVRHTGSLVRRCDGQVSLDGLVWLWRLIYAPKIYNEAVCGSSAPCSAVRQRADADPRLLHADTNSVGVRLPRSRADELRFRVDLGAARRSQTASRQVETFCSWGTTMRRPCVTLRLVRGPSSYLVRPVPRSAAPSA